MLPTKNSTKNSNNNSSSNIGTNSAQSIKSGFSYLNKLSRRSKRRSEDEKVSIKNESISNSNSSNNNNNTSSAFSSGYMNGSAQTRPYTSQQHFYHFGGNNSQVRGNSDRVGVDSNATSQQQLVGARLPSHSGQFEDHQHASHFRQQQQSHRSGNNQTSSMMVPMMIDDNSVDNIDADAEANDIELDIEATRHEASDAESNTVGAAIIGADGSELIDDDIVGHHQLAGLDDANYNSSCYSASRLRSIYATRLNRSRDCALDSSSMAAATDRHHNHQPARYFQSQPDHQYQQQLHYFVPVSTRSQAQYQHKHFFNGSTNSFAPPPLHSSSNTYASKYQPDNEGPDLSLQYASSLYHQPVSAVYHQPNIPNYQLQQQYHSFSYLQPQQLSQLHKQYPNSPINRTLNGSNNRLAGSSVHLLPTSSSQLESSSAGDSSSTTGPPNGSCVALQPSKSKSKSKKSSSKSSKMQNSRQQQHLAPDSHHHHHHHHHQQQQQQQRKLQAIGSRKKAHHSGTTNKNNVATFEKPALSCCTKIAKLLLFITNISFWSAGVALGAWGILSLVEDHKYNLSQLLVFEPNSRMSLFQLLAWSFITLGCATVLVGFCGCSAILKNNRWILGLVSYSNTFFEFKEPRKKYKQKLTNILLTVLFFHNFSTYS